MNKIVLLSLALTFTSCSLLKKNQVPPEQQRIVIVGAGIAGLSAAHFLKKNGYQPIVLEAQDRIGGRIKTNRSLDIPFEEGASWIHGALGNPLTELAEKAGATTYPTDDESIKVYDLDGTEYPAEVLQQEEEIYDAILEDMAGDGKASFANVFYEEHPQYQNQRLWTYMLSAFLEFDTGGDINKLSASDFYDDEDFAGEDVIITNGYDRIVNYLATDLDISLKTKVTAIDYSRDEILISTSDGTFTADQVLVTVPLGVLKKEAIKFAPQLPRRTQNAITNLEMGTVNKFLLIWDSSFWEEDLQYIGYTPEEKGKFNFFLNLKKYTNTNALMTFAFGDYAQETERQTDEEIVAGIMAHLSAIYGQNIPHPQRLLRTRWKENPYAYGAYAYAPAETGSKGFKAFKRPVDRKVFFAGEHTTIDYRGTVHGAYLSGVRTAKKMVTVRR